MHAPVERHLEAVVHEALALQPLTDARLDQQVDGALLKQTRTNARLDVVTRLALEHDRCDPVPIEQL